MNRILSRNTRLFFFFVALMVGGTNATLASASCSPCVRLDGDEVGCNGVSSIISKRGIDIAPSDVCSCAAVQITHTNQGLHVEIQDINGRKISRFVVDQESAASVIESWVREDLTISMLAPTMAEPTLGDNAELPAKTTVDEQPLVAPILSNDAPPHRAIVGLGVQTGVSFDSSIWFGGAVYSCVFAGPLCIGGMFVLNSDQGLSGESKLLGSRRLTVEVTGTFDFPIFLQRFVLRPGLKTGVAMVRMATAYSSDGTKRLVDDETWTWSVGAHINGALELGRGILFVVDVSVDVFPFASTDPYYDMDEDVYLMGLPRGLFRTILGVEYLL